MKVVAKDGFHFEIDESQKHEVLSRYETLLKSINTLVPLNNNSVEVGCRLIQNISKPFYIYNPKTEDDINSLYLNNELKFGIYDPPKKNHSYLIEILFNDNIFGADVTDVESIKKDIELLQDLIHRLEENKPYENK